MTRFERLVKSQRGFTLMELLLALGVSFFIFFIMCAVLVPGVKTCRATTFSLDLTQNARVAVARMVREIRASPQIATLLPESPDDTSIPVSHTIMFEDGRCDHVRYVSYYQSGDQLRRRIYTYHLPADPNKPVTFDAYDEFDNPAVATLNEDVAIAQYVGNVQIWGIETVNLVVTFDYHGYRIPCTGSVAPRNRARPK
jgi:type II secretory pathway pseudopilin PulG